MNSSRGIETAALMITTLVIGAASGYYIGTADSRVEKAEAANSSIVAAVARAEEVAKQVARDARIASAAYAQFNSATKGINENVAAIKELNNCIIPDGIQRMRESQRTALQKAQAANRE